MGRMVLSILIVLIIAATAVADLGFMHASNAAWPPHARLHAVWNVMHVAGTHALALVLLWAGPDAGYILRVRIAVGIVFTFSASFFVAAALSPLFGASVHPDLPVSERPPTPFGLDGNLLGFLIALPLILWAWRRSECEAQSS
jgi:hypothetical protein